MEVRELSNFLNWCAEHNIALVKVDAVNVAPPEEVAYLLPEQVNTLCCQFNNRPIQPYRRR